MTWPGRRPGRSLLAALALVLGVGSMTACSGSQDPPDDAAAALAAGLEDGRLPAGLVIGDGSPQEAYDDLRAGLDPAAPTVEVVAVEEQEGTEDAAVATLAWVWEVEGHRWSYESSAELVRDAGWSRRHFTSRFTRATGLRPKAFARVLRFQRAKELLVRPDASLAAIALDAGYYDQAHLNRDFRAFAGCTPTELMARRLPAGYSADEVTSVQDGARAAA